MTVWDAPISQPYGYDPSYQGNYQHFHYGVDWAAKEGTPITVNGIEIGLVGHTGKVYDQNGQNTINAAHLHVGHYINGSPVDPQRSGKAVDGAKVTQVAEDATNGKYVRIRAADGSDWVYLHMSKQSVTVGQEIKQGVNDMPPADRGFVINRYRQILGREANEDDIKVYLGKNRLEIYDALLDSDEFKRRLSNKPINQGDVINWIKDNTK